MRVNLIHTTRAGCFTYVHAKTAPYLRCGSLMAITAAQGTVDGPARIKALMVAAWAGV